MPVGGRGSEREGRLRAADGLGLHYRERLLPDAVAQIVLVHGVAEHAGRYRGFEEFFAAHGVGVSAMDLRGHGRSEGRRVWVPAFESFLEDLDVFLRLVRSHSRRVFLVGHSLGGLIAIRYAETRPGALQGLIASGAAVKPAIVPPGPVVAALRLLNRLSPATPMPRLLKPQQLSRDPAVVRRYEEDPLVCGHLTTGLGMATLRAAERALAEADRIDVPTLLLHGGADEIVDPAGSEQLLGRLRVPDRGLKIYPGLFHEIFNEPERETVLGDVLRWIEARTRG